MFKVIKCHKCGRIFVYYGERKNPHCPNTRCHTMVTISDKTQFKLIFGTPFPKMKPEFRGNKAYLYLNAFNGELCISVDIYSNDGLNFLTIPLNTDKLELTMEDMLSSFNSVYCPKEKLSEIKIKSGKYGLDWTIRTKLKLK